MSQASSRGVDRRGVDRTFESDEAHKSNLILQARLLREQDEGELAAQHFAKAAEIEESLSNRCRGLGLLEKSLVHQFSAASCWAQAGNFYQAIAICDELLANSELPERLKQDVQEYAKTLRSRRANWYSQLVHAETTDLEG